MKFNKVLLIITSILVLLPVLVGALTWSALPEEMATHWGVSGMADDWSSRAFAVFGVPMILLLLHWICIIATTADRKNRFQNKKALNMVLFIVPAISWFANAIMYASAFGYKLSINSIVFGFLGVLFIIIGNYMPKTKQNRTLGIKISWTLESEENWNATHRLAGKVWVIAGVLCLISIFIPYNISNFIVPAVLVAAMLVPIIYSYNFHRKEVKEGKTFMKNKKQKLILIICAIVLGILLLGFGFIMFTGEVDITYGEDSFTVDSMYYSALTLNYDDITGVWYSEEYIEGNKVNGFNSAKLMLGKYKNEALETYNRYTYTGNNGFVVVETEDDEGKSHFTVIGGKDFEDTKEIYNKLAGNYSFELTYQDDGFTITPSHGEEVVVKYSTVGSTQYREDFIESEKKNAFENNEIMIGEYKNEEFGKHKRYSYYSNDAFIIIEVLIDAKTSEYIIINADTLDNTRALFDELSEKVVE